MTTLLTRGPRRPASPADPLPLPGTAPLWRSCRPHPEPVPGAEGVEDEEVAILFSGNCVPERVYLADALTLSGLLWDASEEGPCFHATCPPVLCCEAGAGR